MPDKPAEKRPDKPADKSAEKPGVAEQKVPVKRSAKDAKGAVTPAVTSAVQ